MGAPPGGAPPKLPLVHGELVLGAPPMSKALEMRDVLAKMRASGGGDILPRKKRPKRDLPTGVTKTRSGKKFKSQIKWRGKDRTVGVFDTPEQASAAFEYVRKALCDANLSSLSADGVTAAFDTASKPLVLPEDKPKIAEFLYVVMDQLQPCRFTEADRNKRGLKNMGSIGVECKHCAGKIDGRKFFWSSVKAVESNFVSVHTHMMECKFIPQELKDELSELKLLRKEQTSRLKFGSQKAFFNTVWDRLHANEEAQKLPYM